MATLVQFFGSLLSMALILAGLLLMVAPPLGRRMLQRTAAIAGLFLMFLFALNAVWGLVRSLNPIVLILGATSVSTLAYFVRERRLGHPERRDGARHAERSPVMPQHIGGEDKE
jgi:uncharacterized protein YjeT (DUF2065 family)